MDLFTSWIKNPDDYDVVKQIGAGRFGRVALVKHKSTDGGEFALREVLDTGALANDKTFMQEIQFFMSVRPHPAIATFHGYWIPKGQRGVLMQYLPEGSLYSILSSTPAKYPAWYTPTVKAKVIFGFAAAMMHLHAHGAVHRYLSPKNIMFDAAHEPRLVDFGLAKISLAQNQLSQISTGDNEAFMAPEALEKSDPYGSGHYDQSLDVFAFAMIVNYIVTGVRPYSDCRAAYLVSEAILRGDRPAIPDCHQILRRIMELGWDSSPVERPSFAGFVSRLILVDEPLFPGVDMAQYRDYRERVMKGTMKRLEDEDLFQLKADLSPKKVAEFEAIKAAAERKDSEAIVGLGRFYEIGHGVVQDDKEAAKYYEEAAKAGNPTGMFNIAIMAQTGRGRDEVDFASAVDWYRKAAAAGIQTAEVLLAQLMSSGQGFARPDPRGAAGIFQRLANPPHNNRDAQYHLGLIYDEGRCGTKDPQQAQKYFQLSHDQGVDGATCDLAAMYLQGRPPVIPANVTLGIETFKQAASRGHPMSHYNLGVIYQKGEYGQAADPVAARAYFEFAAENGITEAQVEFGTILVREGRREADAAEKQRKLEMAARYFRIAAGNEEAGNPVAQNNYGKMLMTGEGVIQDYKSAKEFLIWAVKQGQAMAMVNLADILLNGLDGTKPSRDNAVNLLRRARDAGNREAEARLAKLGVTT
jgi:TPR repeat protein